MKGNQLVKTPVRGLLALLVVMLLGTAVISTTHAQEAPKDGQHLAKDANKKDEKHKNQDFDGKLAADCDHIVDRETIAVNAVISDLRGIEPTRILPDSVDVEVSMNPVMCPGATTADVKAMSVSALSSWSWWTCRAKAEKNTLLGLNYGLYLTQEYQTTPYTNIVWPPPNPVAYPRSGLGWSVKSGPTTSGPIKYSLYNGDQNIVMKGKSGAVASYEYKITWFTVATESLNLNLTFDRNLCESWRS